MTLDLPNIFAEKARSIGEINPVRQSARVEKVIGMIIECTGLSVPIGSYVSIQTDDGFVDAEVVGFRADATLLMPFGFMQGVRRGSLVTCLRHQQSVGVGMNLLGRVLNAKGEPIDGKGPISYERLNNLNATPPDPIFRRPVAEPLGTGIRAIDGLITAGKGQRLGIFAGSGVGKSVLMGMIAKGTDADVSVIALIGERGREVRNFLEKELGPEGLARSVVIVATSDQSPLLRVRAGFVACAVAEYFRDRSMNVMMMMDSVTRVAMAQREIGLSIGEPPATRGYPPSVFSLLPKLLERSGMGETGSITGFYTVLVEGDDMNEPISDTARGILDGHIALSRDLAHQGHYPAIDVLSSLSRVMPDLVDDYHIHAARLMRTRLSSYKEAEDLINMGAYSVGSNPDIDAAIKMIKPIRTYLQQGMHDIVPFAQSQQVLTGLMKAEAKVPGTTTANDTGGQA